MNRFLRGVFRWKFVFYELLLPALQAPRAGRCRRRPLRLGRAAVVDPAGAEGQAASVRSSGAAGRARARRRRSGRSGRRWRPTRRGSWPATTRSTCVATRRSSAGSRSGATSTCDRALAAGKGAILVGSHLGAHIAGLHWLFRARPAGPRLVQRPRHVSRELDAPVRRRARPAPPGRALPPPRPLAARRRSSGWSGPGRRSATAWRST